MDNTTDQQVTIREVILLVWDYVLEVWNKKIIIIAIALLFGLIFAIRATLNPDVYSEKLTFMMDDTSGEASIPGLEMLGDLFGGSGKSTESLDKILRLFESRKIINNTLFAKTDIAGKEDFIINHYLDLYGVDYLIKQYRRFGFYHATEWPLQLRDYDDYRFTSSVVDSMSTDERLLLRLVFEQVNGAPTGEIPMHLVSELDKESGIMTLTMTSEYESLTLAVLNNIYGQLSNFFIEKATEKQAKTYRIMKVKRDSVLTALKSAEFQLANFKDRNRNLVTVKGYLNQLKLERESAILNVMYAEVIRQLEATDFALKNKTPVVQVIDEPRRPILPTVSSWKVGLVLGMMMGAVVACLGIVLFRLLSDIMTPST